MVTTLPVEDSAPWVSADRSTTAGTPLGLYVHVPFCERRCGYCAFNTYVLSESGGAAATERYVAAALAEIVLASHAIGSERPPLTSIYFGGGTPTMLSAGQLARIIAAVRRTFDVRDDLEVTVESNPDGLAPGQLADLRDAGATRVSFGMQSIRRRVLQLLDRTHDPERALVAVAEARAAGFDHVSRDLIYCTPGETEDDWTATLRAALSTTVDHISAYALGIEPGTKLAARVRHGALPNPDDDVAADRYLVADDMLAAAGFDWYEISNWATSADAQCRHNLLYWRNHNWWGIGPGAHSHLGGTRWWNRDAPDAWAAALDEHRSPVAGHEHLTEDQRRLEDVMLGLRLSEGLELASERSAEVERDGLATRERGLLVLSRPGRLLANQVIDRVALTD
ncbi:radical SAM family heme chaperone HemW [soil metagenome]